MRPSLDSRRSALISVDGNLSSGPKCARQHRFKHVGFETDVVNVFFHLCLLYLLLHSLSCAVVSRQQWALMGSEEPLTAVFPVEVQGALAQPDV